MDRLERLQALCKQRGITVNKLEQELDMPQSSLQKIGQSVPKADRLYKVSQYLHVPMEYFFNEEEAVAQIQENLKEYLEGERLKGKPLYRASAGQGAYNDVYAFNSIDDAEEGYEYASVVGESMMPELRDGDTVKILPQTETTPRDYTLVKVDGEHATIKFVEIVDNGVWLRALNKEVYPDRFFTIQEVMTLPVTIIGKVVSFERKL